MVSFDNYYLTYKVILKCFLDFASVFLYHETVELFPSHGVHCLVPWHCYAQHHKGQVDYKSIQGKIGANPLCMCRKFVISCQCSVGVYQDFLTTNHNLNLNYINKKCKSTLQMSAILKTPLSSYKTIQECSASINQSEHRNVYIPPGSTAFSQGAKGPGYGVHCCLFQACILVIFKR